MSGRFIVLEGLDGVGKSTLTAGLAQHLRAALWKPPGEELSSVRAVIDQELSRDPLSGPLFYAATIAEASVKIRAELARGRDVVCDRY